MEREDEFKKLAKGVIARVRKGSAEMILTQRREGLTRFGNNAVSQPVDRQELTLSIRVIRDRREGTATCNQSDSASIDGAIRRAEAMADAGPDNPSLFPLPGPQPYSPLPRFSKKTSTLHPEEKVAAIGGVAKACKRSGLAAAGIFSHDCQRIALANSSGLWAFHEGTSASFSVTTIGNDSSGWAEKSDWDASRIDPTELGRRAIEKALRGRKPKGIAAGPRTVILEPAAVAELLLFMAYGGFGALPFQEGRSFMSGRIGRRLVDERVTILDDVRHPGTLGLPFDFEGMPRKSVSLIEKGIARAVVYDRPTAEKAGVVSTGHALPQPNSAGPLPLNLVMLPGDTSLEEMIASTEDGILVTHFHYTNLLDPIPLTVTGMTRDGTFRIQSGKIAYPVKNLRFTDSVVEAFNRIEGIGREAIYTHAFWGGGTVCPPLKIRAFNFSSETRF